MHCNFRISRVFTAAAAAFIIVSFCLFPNGEALGGISDTGANYTEQIPHLTVPERLQPCRAAGQLFLWFGCIPAIFYVQSFKKGKKYQYRPFDFLPARFLGDLFILYQKDGKKRFTV